MTVAGAAGSWEIGDGEEREDGSPIESGMTGTKKPKVGRLFDETAGYFLRTLVKIAILKQMGLLLFPVQVVDVDRGPVLPIEHGICALVIPASRHVVAIIEIDGTV